MDGGKLGSTGHSLKGGAMMKVNLICFSQTGNTRKVAKAMAEVFNHAGHDVDLIPFKKAESLHLTQADLVGVGAPCFESQAPTPVRHWLNSLPNLTGKNAFVFSTSGGAPGRVLYDLAKPLMSKGASITGGFLSRGECFYPIPCLVNRFPGRPDDQDLESARQFASFLMMHLAAGPCGPMPQTRPDAHRHGLGFYQIMAVMLKEPLMRLLMPEPSVNPEICTQCGWCEKECPTQSITLEPNPVIGGNCIRCYRCCTGCPEKAFNPIKWGISNFMTWTLYNTTFERYLGDVKAGEIFY
jgi:flavodoxin/ferredoxin